MFLQASLHLKMELINSNKKYHHVAYKGFLYNSYNALILSIRGVQKIDMKCPCFKKTDLSITLTTLISVNYDHVHQGNENLISATKVIKN